MNEFQLKKKEFKLQKNSTNLDIDLNENYRKTLFKTNFKFIEFKKKVEDENVNCLKIPTSKTETIEDFYRDLIVNTPQRSSNSNENKSSIITQSSPINESKSNLKNKSNFLKAAEQNDLKLIKNYLENSSVADISLNSCDDFKWNALMIAVVSFSNEIVKYLLEKHCNHNEFKEFLFAKDLSGNDAEYLANKFKNMPALKMIRTAKLHLDSNLVDVQNFLTENENEMKTEDNKQHYCESCKKQINICEESYVEHATSIIHQINESDSNNNISKKINYHLRASSNKGYQILLKSGWNESTGLGSKLQGRLHPLKTKQKLNRFGIGLLESKKTIQNNTKNADSTLNLEKSLKSFKMLNSRNKKMKKIERNLRNYFNTD